MRIPMMVLAITLSLGCSSTKIVDSWRAPGLNPSELRFEHVIAIAVTENPSHRRIAEDALAASATTTRVSPGYTVIMDTERGDVERVRAALTAAGVDGAIVVRLLGSEDKETYVPGQAYGPRAGGFYGYYGHVGTMVYEPGYVRTDTYVRIETTLHDVREEKMLWSGISETINPSSVGELMKEIVEAAGDKLRDQGLVP